MTLRISCFVLEGGTSWNLLFLVVLDQFLYYQQISTILQLDFHSVLFEIEKRFLSQIFLSYRIQKTSLLVLKSY